MSRAVRYHKQGGPEVLQLDEVTVGDPGQGQVRIRHTAIGVNFVDTYQRSGLYPMQLPAVAGNEGAGVVEAVGPGVKGLKKGDRVALMINGLGGTPPSELYVLYRKAALRCKDAGLNIVRNYVGNYCTSLEMAGASLTLLKLDKQIEELLAAPADIAVRVF